MITAKMRDWLEKITKNPQMKTSIKYSVYINRIQKRIEKELDALLWVSVHYPQIILDDEREYRDDTGRIVCHRRLKKLLLTIKALNPKTEVELVLRELDFPDPEMTQVIKNKPNTVPTILPFVLCTKCGKPIPCECSSSTTPT